MDGRLQKSRQLSPERAKVWTERSPKYVQNRKVPVVYYLCRNRQLEHPHFTEVPLSSPEGLYLRDVIEKLNTLRGRGMASMYSWSCKRSYKNGFVWHDLSEDDLIHPAHKNEYVLKGSEIIEESHSGCFSPVGTLRVPNIKQLPEPPSSRSQDDTSSSSSLTVKDMKHHGDDEVSPSSRNSGSSGVSPESRAGNHSSGPCLSLTEYKIYKNEGAADASTQTEEDLRRAKPRETCTRGVSTDDGPIDCQCDDNPHNIAWSSEHSSRICRDFVSPPPCTSAASSCTGKTETLESLIRADASKMNKSRILEEDFQMPSHSKMKASSILMQLISCGSISVKDHNFGLIPTYRPNLFESRFPSPLYSTSMMLGELDCFSDNSRITSMRLEDKEYFSGSLVETKMPKEEKNEHASLKRSSSYNADRVTGQLDSDNNRDQMISSPSNCIPRSIKYAISKHPRSESMRSPLSDKPRISSNGVDGSPILVHDASSNGSSKRMTSPSANNVSQRVDSFREQNEKIVQIEERLASGARVIILSTEQRQ